MSTAFSHALRQYLEQIKARRADQQQAQLEAQIETLKAQGATPAELAPLRLGAVAAGAGADGADLADDHPGSEGRAGDRSGLQAAEEPRRARAAGGDPRPARGDRARARPGALRHADPHARRRRGRVRAAGPGGDPGHLATVEEAGGDGHPPHVARGRRVPAAESGDLADDCAGDGAPTATATGTGTDVGARRQPPKTIVVTSPEARDGKTTVAANLAVAYAEVGRRVLVLSCDLRRPDIDRLFGVPDKPGLAEALSAIGNTDPDERFDLLPYIGLPTMVMVAVMPSGAASDRYVELLGSEQMERLLERARAIADVVVLDCAPLLVASDVVPLLAHADAVVVVARAGKTRSELAARTTELLTRLGGKVVGVVLNDATESSAPLKRHRYYRYYRAPKREDRRGAGPRFARGAGGPRRGARHVGGLMSRGIPGLPRHRVDALPSNVGRGSCSPRLSRSCGR